MGCVIGKSTGALVEATSLGIPVINIEFNNRLSHEYLPKFGKGIRKSRRGKIVPNCEKEENRCVEGRSEEFSSEGG